LIPKSDITREKLQATKTVVAAGDFNLADRDLDITMPGKTKLRLDSLQTSVDDSIAS
jgi:exonuclease III